MNKRAVVWLSEGLESVTSAAIAIADEYEVRNLL